MSRLRHLPGTAWRLGLRNGLDVAAHRWRLKTGRYRRALPRGSAFPGPFFDLAAAAPAIDLPPAWRAAIEHEAQPLHRGVLRYFSCHDMNVGSPPDWFTNPFTGARLAEPRAHWSRLGDFATGVGDIKILWEPSRFGWALTLARAYRATGEPAHLALLDAWVADWVTENPLNVGPNWKCGQETSLRLLTLLTAARLVGQALRPTPALVRFVDEHARRIEPTLRYALAQDNNHGTSEAVALFVAGAWLTHVGAGSEASARWEALGRRWLEERAQRLIEPDGSFSQHSVTYHRLLLDTLCLAVHFQRRLERPAFSAAFVERAAAAVHWLFELTDSAAGDAPNLGANDGARLLALGGGYRDFRPAVQLGAALFLGRRLYGEGPWDEPLRWLDLDGGTAAPERRRTTAFEDGAYVAIAAERSWGLVRGARPRFRPSQADALHLDLWHRGLNVLRDAGSFSYNAGAPWDAYFNGTAAHNTVQFDGRDQMPRLSRFLFGAWLNVETLLPLRVEAGTASWAGAYVDYRGARHERRVSVQGDRWVVTDRLSGFRDHAVMRWRLAPVDWQLRGDRCESDLGAIQIACEGATVQLALVEGWESRHYMSRTQVPVLEATVTGAQATLTTIIDLPHA